MTALVRHITARALGALSISIFTILVLDVLWGVITRYLFGYQAIWSEELARLLLVWLSMLGGALAYIDRAHLGVDILTRMFDPDAGRIAGVTSHLLVLLFSAGVMVYGGSELFLERWASGQVLSALPILKAWVYLSVPVSGLVIAIFALDSVIGAATGRDAPPPSTATAGTT